MKIKRVVINNHRKALEIHTREHAYAFPYAKLRVRPSATDRIVEAYPDEEIGREGFTYRLASGLEDTIHLDAVLDYHQDPAYMRDLLVYRLTSEARAAVEESALSKRELIRRLGTSASQFYRLLDPAHQDKSVAQLLVLLHLVGREVKVVEREPQQMTKTG